jgi:hypothetical protein
VISLAGVAAFYIYLDYKRDSDRVNTVIQMNEKALEQQEQASRRKK